MKVFPKEDNVLDNLRSAAESVEEFVDLAATRIGPLLAVSGNKSTQLRDAMNETRAILKKRDERARSPMFHYGYMFDYSKYKSVSC